PRSVLLLRAGEEGRRALDRAPVGVLRVEERGERPRGLHDLRLLVLDVPMLEDAREVLAPAAVGALALLHPRAGAADLRVDGGHAAGEETAHAEHGPVDEVHAPDAGPASVGALAAAQHADGALDGGVDLVAQDVRVAGAEGGERR